MQRGSRSPSTLDLYRHAVERHVIPGVGALRLGDVSTARMDRFLQSVLDTSGYATATLCRTVLWASVAGSCVGMASSTTRSGT